MNKLITLKIEMSYGPVMDYIYPAVLCDNDNCVLVDCGYVGSLPKIEKALQCNGLPPKAITHIILTHQDHDHVGAAAAFKQKYPNVLIFASAEEAPYISGSQKSLRLEQAERLQKELPAEQQEFGKTFCRLLRSVEPVPIDRMLSENEVLPFCGGCQVIATPGHTPGHISLYLEAFDTILSGDSMALEQGRPVLANPQFTLDIEKANVSMQRILLHPARRIICYHGGLFEKENV
ncbi:Hydroxyacylglutathione hydrolase [anaerobic digester metagenome]|jgi:glyoxylase-like metal-dependent hydrolase (beta-lactamase superfamily II)|uniref:MBL fold metallo-hydrolase n=1 Tax=Oscillibacter ruminantium TaxID=1263547 RepID=UPI00058FD120|nr:MBL fold metallo-hydrolase [Oscillibacter ruminantium]